MIHDTIIVFLRLTYFYLGLLTYYFLLTYTAPDSLTVGGWVGVEYILQQRFPVEKSLF